MDHGTKTIFMHNPLVPSITILSYKNGMGSHLPHFSWAIVDWLALKIFYCSGTPVAFYSRGLGFNVEKPDDDCYNSFIDDMRFIYQNFVPSAMKVYSPENYECSRKRFKKRLSFACHKLLGRLSEDATKHFNAIIESD